MIHQLLSWESRFHFRKISSPYIRGCPRSPQQPVNQQNQLTGSLTCQVYEDDGDTSLIEHAFYDRFHRQYQGHAQVRVSLIHCLRYRRS